MTIQNQNPNNKRILGEPYHPPMYSIAAPTFVPSKVGVYEDILNKRIMFPAAGYTQTVNYYPGHKLPDADIFKAAQGKNRQEVLHSLKAQVIVGSLVAGKGRLVMEPFNPFDSAAIQVVARVLSRFGGEIEAPIGYVPANINKQVIAGWEYLKLEDIYVCLLKDPRGHDVAMVVIPYEIYVAPKDSRFARIQYD